MDSIGWKFYIIFIVLNTIDGGLMYGTVVRTVLFLTRAYVGIAFFPETKGLTLEEMSSVFGDHTEKQAIEQHVGAQDANSDHLDEKA